MINVIESVSISKLELWLIKFTHIEMITFKSASLATINDVVFLS
jgi:hypothetical protein